MLRFMKDENLQNEIMKKGYAVVSLFSEEEVAQLLNSVKNNLPNYNNILMQNGALNPKGFHVTILDSDIEYKSRADKIVQDVFLPHVENLFIDYKVLGGGFYVKPSGSEEIGLHRDWAFTDNFNDVNITIWCPLVDVDEKNGALYMVEGSHKLVPNIETPLSTFFFSEYSGWLKGKSKNISLKLGEVVIFDNTILHGSNGNNSDSTRYAVNLLCVPKDARTVFYYPDKTAPDNKFDVFETADDFYSKHAFSDFFMGNIKTTKIASVENKNRLVNLPEFEELLKNGDEIRRVIYFPEEVKHTNEKPSWLKRIRRMLRTKTTQ